MWIPLLEWCYNTTCHSLIGVSRFEAIYCNLPHRLVSCIPSTSVNVSGPKTEIKGANVNDVKRKFTKILVKNEVAC